jgi:maleylacetoacetate isomerase
MSLARSDTLTLYDNASSNASVRTRIILYLKGIPFEWIEVDLIRDRLPSGRPFLEVNNQGMVPTLRHKEFVLTQSFAIAEYLDEIQPQPRLLPSDVEARAFVRSLALLIAADGQPIVNLRVRRFLQKKIGLSRDQLLGWMQHWLSNSLNEYEGAMEMRRVNGPFSFGTEPTIADAFLVPQVLLAKRFGVDVSSYKKISAVYSRCMELTAFERAASEYVVQDAEYGI